MNAVVLYGPPAVGKLTVGRALRELTGYRLFHNHLTIDIGLAVFDDVENIRSLVRRLRLDVFAAAASGGVAGVIFTYAYRVEDGGPFLDDLVTLVTDAAGHVRFVQLTCDQAELERRVISPSRQGTEKLTDVTKLRATLASDDVFASVPGHESLVVDNSSMSPREVAALIAKRFGISNG